MKVSLKLSALSFAMLMSFAVHAQVSLTVSIAPPPLPVYEQPLIPGEGYIWTPGYWAWNTAEGDYYWVPGTWTLAPAVGLLWTPGYWAFEGVAYRWRPGYWGRSVGFYGGINYGYGYTGHGYWGGRWNGRIFQYNQSVNHIDRRIVRNVYVSRVVVRDKDLPRVSFNGHGGVESRPTVVERRALAVRHVSPTPLQVTHERTALGTSSQRMAVNHGAPQVAATPRPSAFAVPGAVHAREPGNPTAPGHANAPGGVTRPMNNRVGAGNPNEPPTRRAPQPVLQDRGSAPGGRPVEPAIQPQRPIAERPVQSKSPPPPREPQAQPLRPAPQKPAMERPQVDRSQVGRQTPERAPLERPQVQRPEKPGPGPNAAEEGRGGQGHKERQHD